MLTGTRDRSTPANRLTLCWGTRSRGKESASEARSALFNPCRWRLRDNASMLTRSPTAAQRPSSWKGGDISGAHRRTLLAACFTRPAVQNLPDLCRQSRKAEGLDDQLQTGIEPTLVNDGILRVTGSQQNFDIGVYLTSLVR